MAIGGSLTTLEALVDDFCNLVKLSSKYVTPESQEEFERQIAMKIYECIEMVMANIPLLDRAIQRIHERVSQKGDSPSAVLRKGEGAYQLHKDKWDQQYAGRYIAIYQGEVIASDAKKTKLTEKIFKKQREEGPLRACVIKIESSAAGGKKL